MSWPMKLRVFSFFIGIGVVLSEVAIVAIPIGVGVWLAGAADALRIAEVELAIGLATALVIIVPAHVRPTNMAPLVRNGGSK